MHKSRKTALVLLPKAPSQTHIELFAHMGQALQFDLVHLTPGDNRAWSILQASFVLVDVSGNDPEVLYCLGVAHTFGKRVFLITDTLDTLPFDLASNRTWVIDPSSDNGDIHQAMVQFLSVPNAVGPVRLFLGKFAFFGENLIAWRFLAFLIDAVCMLVLVAIALHLVMPGDQSTFTERIAALVQQAMEVSDGPVREQMDMVLASAVYLVLAYFALSTWLLRATLGQLITGLRVVQTDYRRVTFGQCVGRSLLSMVVVMTWGASFLSAIRGPGYQAVHDILSGTIVVRSHGF